MDGMSHISICNVAVGGVGQLHTEQTTALLSLLSAIIVHRLVLHLSTHLVCCLLHLEHRTSNIQQNILI